MSKGTVMVVDDDAGIREALHEILEGEGYWPVMASNGQDALDQLHQGVRPCLILLDLMMPVMDGWKFCDAQQCDPKIKDVPVVVITASGTHKTPIVGKVLAKPLNLDELLKTIADIC
jgi:two-component system, chemotaxis family, chemotaxis protein CheY